MIKEGKGAVILKFWLRREAQAATERANGPGEHIERLGRSQGGGLGAIYLRTAGRYPRFCTSLSPLFPQNLRIWGPNRRPGLVQPEERVGSGIMLSIVDGTMARANWKTLT